MPPRYLTAFEHQPIQVYGEGSASTITSSEADYLALLGELRPGFCERGYRTVRLSQYCGIVSLGDRVLEILPKIDRGSSRDDCRGLLIRLLRESQELPIFRHLSVGQQLRHAPLLEVFIAAFFEAVTEIVRGGLLRQYQELEEDLHVVRGRIIASRQFAVHSNRPDLIACRFDELTADNIWNRFIKAGLRAVRPWIVSVELNRRWVELMVVFDEAEDARMDAKALNGLVVDRQVKRYQVAVEWVRWILALLSPALRAGEKLSPGLLFDMNLLFQSAIAAALRRGVPPGTQVQAQDTGTYLATVVSPAGRRAFGLRPDLVVRSHAGVVAVGDTKWKRLEVGRSGYLLPAQEDIYQMQAYATAYKCQQLALIYPWHSGLVGSNETAFELLPIGALRPTVNVICVDLHSDPFAIVRGSAAVHFGGLFSAWHGRVGVDSPLSLSIS